MSKNGFLNIDHLPGRTLMVEGNEFLWFSGTSYLGMAFQPEFKENLFEGLQYYGASWGSSRNNTVRLSIYEEAESALAQFCNMPEALTVSSGILAGQMVVKFVEWLENQNGKNQQTAYYYAPKTHPALWKSNTILPAQRYQNWANELPGKIRHSTADHFVIFSDSVGSPYVETFDFEWLANLPNDKNISVIIDASHSLGIQLPVFKHPENVRLVITSSLNKAMGMVGGVILSDAQTIQFIRNLPVFAGASPMMPALLYAFTKSQEVYERQRIKLMKNIQAFTDKLNPESVLEGLENYPAFCTHAEGLHDFLKENGIITACFPYPSIYDKPVTRLVISALHTQEDLSKLSTLCSNYNL
ncbi:7-keto-8-aminopelargonate synthetase [Pseudarcicella hirudinis]|uniref:7-keto-8-aminopelargonate synthetase n=1 Tax=Pseudarcicella hirudinis TaxID=1079859 RepID=A0A1I5NUC7_9BACT|nr:aminotransferase class I/II-fold pyridoxal phosphate-dependent enzyme [Pseudarcicella hirudinis]SFP25327.1 7-keto-8-aminopelargonate synthetase [Pseudarcicella hirudinis]